MTHHSPPPNSYSGREPDEVDSIDEMLSALADGSLPANELIELEEHAVANDQTLDRLSAPYHAVKLELSDLLNDPAPTGLRDGHLAAALDAMAEPEVASLAAARATKSAQAQKSERINRRLRQMSGVAAGFAVIAGISLVALQGGLGSGSDGEEAATSAAPATTVAASEEANETFAMEEAEPADGTAYDTAADDSSADDEAEVQGAIEEDSMEESDDAMEEDPEPTAGEGVDVLRSGDEPFALAPAPAVSDLTLGELSSQTGVEQDRLLQRDPGSNASGAICLAEAIASGIPEAQIQRTLIVEQSGDLYELVVLVTQELRVFQLDGCSQID